MDDLNKRGFQDDVKINIHQVWEVIYWSNELGITHNELKDAVKAVGPSVKKVKAYLRK